MSRPAAPPKDEVWSESQPQPTATRFARPAEDGLNLRYSLMQVPDDPDHYVPTPKRKREYAHVGSLDGSSYSMNRTKVPKHKSSKRNGNYVARAPPSSRRVSTRPVKTIRDLRQHGARASSKATRDKRRAVLEPLVEKSLARTLSQQNRLSYLATPPEMKARPKPDSPSRAPSQRRSLTRFTKELERYCMAVNANGKAPLPICTPTVSDSPTTLDTVTELLPYHRQFKAAGLAVTSREQMPRIPESIHRPLPVVPTRNRRHLPVARVQIDGSTVTPSEQESGFEDAAVPAVPRREDSPPTASTPAEPQFSTKQAKPVNKYLLPWARNEDSAVASRTHTGREVSGKHLHPSQAMAAQPVLTPFDNLGIIDAYFNSNSTAPNKPLDKQPETLKTSISSPSPSKESPILDKPLPEQPSVEQRPTLSKPPPIERRRVPSRSERRHMENTSQWPTARVLIHDSSPPPQDAKHVVEIRELPPSPIKDPTPSSSSSPPAAEEIEATIQRYFTPPADVTRTRDAEEKPPARPKDDRSQQLPPTTDRRQSRSQSLSKQWSKVTVLRRRSKGRHVPMPTTIQEEPETSPEKGANVTISSQQNGNEKQPISSQSQSQSHSTSSGPSGLISEQTSDLVPQLPYTWENTVESSSSFEKALDSVIQKLDDMEERRQQERNLDLEAVRKTSTEQEFSEATSSNKSKPSTRPDPEPQASAKTSTPTAEAASQTEDSVDYLDNDIADRDVLLGLKMAICAACDPDLDAWIREKTGLRLRRFLADLKAFDAVSKDGRPGGPAPHAPQPLHRQIRRNGNEARRLKAERERRRQSMKKTLLPCFGADGSLPGSG